jgi:acyl dehydratase
MEEARALVGVPLRRAQHNYLASSPAINRWARNIGDRNPLWLDPDYAANSALRQAVAPPCWLYSVDDTCIAPKLPGCHVVYGGTEWEFYRWVRLGDRVFAQSRLIDLQEKSGRFCGPMALQVGETVFTGEEDQPIARAISHVLRTPRQAAVQAGKYRDWRKYTFSQEELRIIEDAYDAEEIRGGHPRYWEEVKAGDLLPSIVRGPLTSEEVSQFISATRPSLGFKRFLRYRRRHPDFAFLDPDTGSWESWEASMLRDEVAQRFGFPFAHDAGIDRFSWVGNLITNWMSDQGFLKSLKITLLLPNIYGDVTWCRGRVTGTYRQEGQGLVDLELWCDNQRGQQTAQGRATVALPSREGLG